MSGLALALFCCAATSDAAVAADIAAALVLEEEVQRDISETSSSCRFRRETLVGNCPGGLSEPIQLWNTAANGVATAEKCRALCCHDSRCVTWRFRGDIGCERGGDVRIGKEMDGPGEWCDSTAPLAWTGEEVLASRSACSPLGAWRSDSRTNLQMQCFGFGSERLTVVGRHKLQSADHCRRACCESQPPGSCGAWQWREDVGCFFGEGKGFCLERKSKYDFAPFQGERKIVPGRTYSLPPRRRRRILRRLQLQDPEVPAAARAAAVLSPPPFSCPSGGYCGSCPAGSLNWDSIHFMLLNTSPGLKQFHAAINDAVSMFRSFPGINSDDHADTHLTVQYLCCLNATQMATVRKVVAAHIPLFPKLAVRFGEVICRTVSFIATVDAATQTRLGAWVNSVEDAIIAAGVPVHTRRAQQAPFHATIATYGAAYDNSSAIAMAAVNAKYGANTSGFNVDPIEIDGAVFFPA